MVLRMLMIFETEQCVIRQYNCVTTVHHTPVVRVTKLNMGPIYGAMRTIAFSGNHRLHVQIVIDR